ncbi:DinB family protein [Flagellimonas aurea]|uniref:DinB family protein n=1 Tax=Flagellimonas aurea TaxID=2915619 RepID=UPI0035CF3CEC
MKTRVYYKDAPEYCHYYFDLVDTDHLLNELEGSKEVTIRVLDRITQENLYFSPGPKKWNIAEIIRHIIDCERVYSYRAFRFSRFDPKALPSFDENRYVDVIQNHVINLYELREEYEHVRNSTISLYKQMNDEMLDFKGRANQVVFTPRSLGFMTVGHNLHHIQTIVNSYLQQN